MFLRGFAWLATLALLPGCVGKESGVRLYAGPPRSKWEVAHLSGPIVKVDGESQVAGGGSFELLPGCHVVQIGGRIGDMTPTPQSGWSALLPPLVYTFAMRPGYSYAIAFEPEPALGRKSIGFGNVTARETSPNGQSRVVAAARGPEDLETCRRDALGAATR